MRGRELAHQAVSGHDIGAELPGELAGPFPGLHLMPTGGVDAENAEDFLRAGATALAVGGGLVSDGATTEMIQRRARALVATIGSTDKERPNGGSWHPASHTDTVHRWAF